MKSKHSNFIRAYKVVKSFYTGSFTKTLNTLCKRKYD